MIRFCPNCRTERPLNEIYCQSEVKGKHCEWNLSGEPLRPEGWRPVGAETVSGAEEVLTAGGEPAAVPAAPPAPLQCPDGHAIEPGDLMCPICGWFVPDNPVGATENPADADVSVVSGWGLERELPGIEGLLERYEATHQSDGRRGILTLYLQGQEPDTGVYEVLRQVPADFTPQLLDYGRWQDRAFDVCEVISGGSLAHLPPHSGDWRQLAAIVREVGAALAALTERGIRHRDLTPHSILVRSHEPLDLVIAGFGSAQLAEFDLETVAPLETSRYTAPEAIVGGVAAASDWWSLGIILLERVTGGACFQGVNDQAFLIHVLAAGVAIPEDIDPHIHLLLRGLLALDRRERWGWSQVQSWLEGGKPPAPRQARGGTETSDGKGLRLGGELYRNPSALALAAAQASNWDEARTLFLIGGMATWAEEAGLSPHLQAELRQLARQENLAEDLRLALALKLLNPNMPLVCRGEMITPAWLLEHPAEGYALISGEVPDTLAGRHEELWLQQLKQRAERVRERAEQLRITLNETDLKIHLLATSRSKLEAVWEAKRRVLPDTEEPGLLSLIERRKTEEDLILLLSADNGYFRTADAIIQEASKLARRQNVDFDEDAAREWLSKTRREVHAALDERIQGFARCGHGPIDAWADQLRLERHIPIARALVMLAVPAGQWQSPARQAYVETLLEFFSRRLTTALMRGPLTRMRIGKATARLDLTELGSQRRPAGRLLDHLLLRNGQKVEIDPQALALDPRVESRLRRLQSQAILYKRDTGIDGLYLGFPFLVFQEDKPNDRPRIAPVLLWPVKLNAEIGARARVTVSFDRDREEVRLNPAFETMLGPEAAQRWQDKARELLGRAALTASDVADAFSGLAKISSRQLTRLPAPEGKVPSGEFRLECAAVLFHLAFVGQAVMEDLRRLRALPLGGTSLETMLRVGEAEPSIEVGRVSETERYFTADTDPSQERAVMEARSGKGLVIEGPPGTGKSQTIVNMVADAIGQGRSLLVVCQKQAALEVVHKRLRSEGLEGRMVLINDINKDRKQILQSIRDQLDDLRTHDSGSDSWKQKRAELASRIDTLEGELNAHHQALHNTDEECGLSYRQIMAGLIGFAQNGPCVEVPQLRPLLAKLNAAEAARLQEVCGAAARYWLPSQYENNPLSALQRFDADKGTLHAVERLWSAYCAAENERDSVVQETGGALAVLEPGPLQAWMAQNQPEFLSLNDNQRRLLAHCAGSLWPADYSATRTVLAKRIKEIAAALETAGEEARRHVQTPSAAELAASLPEADLSRWIAVADELARPAGFWGLVSPGRWSKQRALAAFLAEHGFQAASDFASEFQREKALRPLRNRLIQLFHEFQEPVDASPLRRPEELAAQLEDFARRLQHAIALVQKLTEHPFPEAARAAARQGNSAGMEELGTLANHGLRRFGARQASLSALENLEPWFEASWLEARVDEVLENKPSRAAIGQILGAWSSMEAYQRFRARAGSLDKNSTAVFACLRQEEDQLRQVPEADLEAQVRGILGRESRLAWKNQLENRHPALLLEQEELKAKVLALADADAEMRRLNKQLLTRGIDQSQIGSYREWEGITRFTGQRALRLREFMDKGAELGLMELRPIWLMNPDIASRVLPLNRAMFDTVIFDEASQMPIEYALPSLFRSGRVVVSGDEKQMPPSSFFSSRVENDEAELYEGQDEEELEEEGRAALAESWDRREIKDCPDLLQLAKTILPTTTLQIHYRSEYSELIRFSNAAFYRNGLSVPARHPESKIREVQPVEVIEAEGIYAGQTNRDEAEIVTDVLARLWKVPREQRKSTGVVTFNLKQADLIDAVLEERAERDEAFRLALAQEQERMDREEDMSFFVKNVENVQGDERDIIIFSSTFGRNAQGTFRRQFGVLGNPGGERRLNVAVTRAREKVVLVTSMPIGEISDFLATRRPPQGPRDYLQAYFEYARALSAGETEYAGAVLARVNPNGRRTGGMMAEESDEFQNAVAAEIAALGWKPVPVKDHGAFGVDFAIENPRTGLFGIGIECDAPRHTLLNTARARELWRPSVLGRSIPAIHRVTSRGWYQNPVEEKVKLAESIRRALEHAV